MKASFPPSTYVVPALIEFTSQTEWHDVIVDETIAEATWKGIKRKYWDLRVYKLPVAIMNI
jgi:hypothetical protein